MLKVAYDITSLAESPYGGVARVCYHTLDQALRNTDVSPTAYYRKGQKSHITLGADRLKKCGPLAGLVGPVYDIAHSLCHRTLRVRSEKKVYQVHDVWSLSPNRYQSPGFQKKVGERMRRDIVGSDFIITISETTRQNLLRHDLISPEKCAAVHLGYSEPDDVETGVSNPQIESLKQREYVLYVGCLETRKNLGHIIDAVLPIDNVNLVIAGTPGYGYEEEVRPKLATFPSERLLILSTVNRDDLSALYANAVATLLPSWEEGFGLPIVEAMNNGCPIVTSNRSANAEVGGEGAILVNPENPDESREAIERLIEDQSFTNRMIEAGRRRASLFTWERYFDRLVDIYDRLLED